MPGKRRLVNRCVAKQYHRIAQTRGMLRGKETGTHIAAMFYVGKQSRYRPVFCQAVTGGQGGGQGGSLPIGLVADILGANYQVVGDVIFSSQV